MQLLFMEPSTLTRYQVPPTAHFPLPADFLNAHLTKIVPHAVTRVWFEWYPTTSDVLIAHTLGDTVDELNLWTLNLIAVDQMLLPRAQQLLQSEGIAKVTDWFDRCDRLLYEDKSRWVGYTLTIRFENNVLIYSESDSFNLLPRPEPGWPQRPYRPHNKNT